MKRYAQQYVCKLIEGKWRITLYTFDTARKYSSYISKSFVNAFYKRDQAERYLRDLFDTLKFEFGKEDEISYAKTERTMCVSHYYD